MLPLIWLAIILAGITTDDGPWINAPPSIDDLAIVTVQDNEGCGSGVITKWLDRKLPRDDRYRLAIVLTADHVSPKDECLITFHGGKAAKGTVVARNVDDDSAAILVWAPEADVIALEVTATPTRHRERLTLRSYGGNCLTVARPVRAILGDVVGPVSDGRTFLDICAISGDSGAPILNEHHEVVGIVSGGWQWYEIEGRKDPVTWPCRASGPAVLAELVRRASSARVRDGK